MRWKPEDVQTSTTASTRAPLCFQPFVSASHRGTALLSWSVSIVSSVIVPGLCLASVLVHFSIPAYITGLLTNRPASHSAFRLLTCLVLHHVILYRASLSSFGISLSHGLTISRLARDH